MDEPALNLSSSGDAVENIVTWRQQADNDAVMWDYGYDNADRLTREARHGSTGDGPEAVLRTGTIQRGTACSSRLMIR